MATARIDTLDDFTLVQKIRAKLFGVMPYECSHLQNAYVMETIYGISDGFKSHMDQSKLIVALQRKKLEGATHAVIRPGHDVAEVVTVFKNEKCLGNIGSAFHGNCESALIHEGLRQYEDGDSTYQLQRRAA